jgi:DNA-binding transcriptional LysR family regulator
MPNSTVSARVSSLEKNLGVTLLQRTTRKLHVTDEGDAFFQRCVRALAEIQSARSEVGSASKEPVGVLRLSAPVDLGHWALPALVRLYHEKYPKVEIDLVVTNRRVDLIAEGIDLAIRAGAMDDSSLVAKKMMTVELALYASAAYLKKHGAPKHPKQLAEHRTIRFTQLRKPLELANGKESAVIALKGPIGADDPETVKMLLLQDLGISVCPSFLCDQEVQAGRLTRVLPQWKAETGAFSFVYPAQRFVPPKVRALIDLAPQVFANCPR